MPGAMLPELVITQRQMDESFVWALTMVNVELVVISTMLVIIKALLRQENPIGSEPLAVTENVIVEPTILVWPRTPTNTTGGTRTVSRATWLAPLVMSSV